MIESLKLSATFEASCIKSRTAPFCHDFVYTASKFDFSVSSLTVFQCVWNKIKENRINKQTKTKKAGKTALSL